MTVTKFGSPSDGTTSTTTTKLRSIMGCCSSQPSAAAALTHNPKAPAEAPKEGPVSTPASASSTSGNNQAPMNTLASSSSPASSGQAVTPSADSVPPAGNGVAPKSYVAPAPGVKHVRAAYSGKGWAPPQKEWEATEKRKGDKTKIEVEDEWDEDGNLRRTTIKHITTPDWKVKKEKTIEIIPADEAEKMGLGRTP